MMLKGYQMCPYKCVVVFGSKTSLTWTLSLESVNEMNLFLANHHPSSPKLKPPKSSSCSSNLGESIQRINPFQVYPPRLQCASKPFAPVYLESQPVGP